MMSDTQIINEVRNGQTTKFEMLFSRYSKMCIYFFSRNRMLSMETSMDLTQEVFLKVFNKIHQFKPDTSFKAWLLAITRNVANDFFRSQRNTSTCELKEAIADGNSENDLIKRTLVRNALRSLPERQREVVELKYFWGFYSAEIGCLMNMPDGTVRSDLHQARRRLMEVLEEG